MCTSTPYQWNWPAQSQIQECPAHYIAKYNKRFSEYGQLCKLDQVKGLDVETVYYGQNGSIWSLFSDFVVGPVKFCSDQ